MDNAVIKNFVMEKKQIMPIEKGTVLAVAGPTASGKTALGVALARALGGEIISADSMQIYRGMDVGTAKITAEEARGIPHHLLDIRRPGENFSAADYQLLAREEIRRLLEAGKLPIFVGGTGLYLYAALYNYDFSQGENREESHKSRLIRAELEKEADSRGSRWLWEELKKVDAASAEKIHENDRKRLIRALEYHRLYGRPISRNREALTAPKLLYPTRFLGLFTQRQLLYRRIDRRVDQMLEQGLEAEVKALKNQGLTLNSQAGQAIGYKQMLEYFQGNTSYEEAVRRIKQESRRYAKRQLTWFGRNPDILWLDSQKLGDQAFVEGLIRDLRPANPPLS